MDGVLTSTARLHAAAWKQMFDEYLADRAARSGTTFEPFVPSDYRRYIDGRLRYDGVRSFLESRGIELPLGELGDPSDRHTICGLGNRKNELFGRLLDEEGVDIYEDSIAWLRQLRRRGFAVAVVSASRNCERILAAAGITGLMDARIDGVVAAEMGLAGKPAPDTYLAAAGRLGVEPVRAVVVEDAVSGVQAGREGGFGLVIAIDRTGDAASLLGAGADLVVATASELLEAERAR